MPILLLAATVVAEEPSPQAPWKANIGLSAVINTGNSENVTGGGNSLLRWKQQKNEISWKNKGAYGRATINGTSATTTNNFQSELRYDRYFSKRISGFLIGRGGYDRPAGFDFRGGSALGFAHRLIDGPKHFFRYELGPAHTYENRTNNTTDHIIDGRAFIGYAYAITDGIKLEQDIEFLTNLEQGRDSKINGLTSLKVRLSRLISFQAAFDLRYDNRPVPGNRKLDTTTTLGLIFDLI